MTAEIHTSQTEDRTIQVMDGDPGDQRDAIRAWLLQNSIDPTHVDGQPITLEFRMRGAGSFLKCDGTATGPWWIAFTSFHTGADGHKEYDIRAGRWATCARSVPLLVAPSVSLVPEWEHEQESAYQQDDPLPKFAKRSEIEQCNARVEAADGH
jgi:hypothetical protein